MTSHPSHIRLIGGSLGATPGYAVNVVATGARMMVSLPDQVKRPVSRCGLEPMCVGGSQGAVAIFERMGMMAKNKTGLLTSPFVQMAYVTNDFEAALRLFAGRHGVARFLELRDFSMETLPGQDAIMDIGLAWAGGVQIEIIRPLSGADQAYRELLSGGAGFELRFHHEAQQLPSLAALNAARAEAEAQGFPIVIDGKNAAGVTYFYADCRETIGHHVEYIYYPEAVWAQVDAGIPRN